MNLSIQLPEDLSSKIWRYVDLPKFLSVLEGASLYLARADHLGDPFEGSFSPRSLDNDDVNAGDKHFTNSWRPLLKRLPYWTYISCWHLSSCESAALWQLYAGTPGAVAVQSSVAKLAAVTPSTVERGEDGELIAQDVSMVSYLDYREVGPDLSFTSGPYICKRASFAHEKELRAIVQILPSIATGNGKRAINLSAPDGPPGITRSIEVADFIEAIYVAPSSPGWYFDLVRRLLDRYQLGSISCRRSDLEGEPFF